MAVASDRQRIQHSLAAFDFKTLFVEELGWDILREAPLAIVIDGQTYTLRPLVEKRGFKVYLCSPDAQGHIPASGIMRQIERDVTTHAYEHLIIYTDAARTQQAWQWVKREPGKPSATRLYRLHTGQSGELLAQKLLALAFSIEEEDQLGTTSVAARVRQALDAERVTKKFYDRFQKEHAAFLTFIDGIAVQSDREWYASLMLNRLMFVYFIQKKGLLDTKRRDALDGDPHYLVHKLREMQERYGADQFYSFYRYFLLKLFHEGLGSRDHSSDLEALLGNVPYLNGGLFDIHLLERDYPAIQIADEAFERIFAFFDDFDWHLDDRPLRNDREINPDVLGYIFEKYINQKQMGAYYTKEDITGYISKNTIIPFIFTKVAERLPEYFTVDGPIWSLLKMNPDEYIYEEVAHGQLEPLPPEIEAGIADFSQRGSWNEPADERYALPTETWREVVERRRRYDEVKKRLEDGKISAIDDLITYNLNITRFAQDVIATCQKPKLLQAFYEVIEQITVLDPTCGSGAFLFAALNILRPLYQACIERMKELTAEHDRQQARLPAPQRKEGPFKKILDYLKGHRSQDYHILKAIIINNLYGVDIMEEAIEICKLRLFLKLVAQIESPQQLEPLPDIDFNVLPGNTLIGFTSMDEVRRVVTTKLINLGDTEKMLQRIEQQAQEIERDEQSFRNMQTTYNIEIDSTAISEYKQRLRKKLEDLRQVLDPYLATEYGIYKSKYTDC